MTKKYETDIVEKALCRVFPQDWLRQTAEETGFVKRERKIDPVIMFWVLVFSFGVRLQRTIASIKRSYEKDSKTTISDSSFYERFTPELVAFLKKCVIRGIEYMAQQPNRILKEKLQGFKDLFIQDSSIIRVHDKLAHIWPATRSRKVAAGIKIGMLISAVADGPKNITLHAEKTAEIKTIKIGPWIKDRIILLDRGFFKYQLFTRIKDNGGFFVSRLKKNADPLIVKNNLTVQGRSIDVVGKNINAILPTLKRQKLDVEVEVEFKRRKYRGKSRKDTERFRLIAIYNKEAEKYHTYITNIPIEKLDASDIAALYSARWDIELIFKELKSRYSLDVIDTENPQIIEAYIWIAILTLLVSRRIYRLVRELNPGKKTVRYTKLRWSTIFCENASDQLTLILRYCGIERTLQTIMDVYNSQALDPHVNRKRLMEDWVT